MHRNSTSPLLEPLPMHAEKRVVWVSCLPLFSIYRKEFSCVTGWESKLIGFGCDGTSVNMGANGLQGYLEESVPWVILFWCLAHRLELALKDALTGTLFSAVDELLLRVYYLYKLSPKKCHELDEVIAALKLCLEPGDLPNEGGSRPLRACGTHFVSPKLQVSASYLTVIVPT